MKSFTYIVIAAFVSVVVGRVLDFTIDKCISLFEKDNYVH